MPRNDGLTTHHRVSPHIMLAAVVVKHAAVVTQMTDKRAEIHESAHTRRATGSKFDKLCTSLA